MNAAARLGDPTEHGGVIFEGSATVSIEGEPAARLHDYHVCPVESHGLAHVGGPISSASKSVLINGLGAARVGDTLACDSKPLPPPPAEQDFTCRVGDVPSAGQEQKSLGKSNKAVVRGFDGKFTCSASRISGTLSGSLGTVTGSLDAFKAEGRATAGLTYDPSSGAAFGGVDVGGSVALLEAKATVTSPLFPIPGNYGIGVEGEASVSAGAAAFKVTLGVKVDADGTIHLTGGERLAAFFGESLKGGIVIKPLNAPAELPPDHIRTGAPHVLVGD